MEIILRILGVLAAPVILVLIPFILIFLSVYHGICWIITGESIKEW